MKARTQPSPHLPTVTQRGLSLVEVMVTLAIGMVVTLGIVGIMGINQQNLRITEGLSESQENARMAFELIARDVRQARDTSCGPVSETPAPLNGNWWGQWQPLLGLGGATATTAIATGDGAGQRVAGTQALQLQGSGETGIIRNIDIASNQIELQATVDSLGSGPIILCNLQTASLHTATAADGGKITPSPAVEVTDDLPFQVARLTAVTWYIGNNGRAAEGGRSLYRVRLQPDGNPITEEILPGVVDLSVRYHAKNANDFTSTAPTTRDAWNLVNAIELTLTTESTQRNVTSEAASGSELVGSDGRMRRQITHVISLRNTL